MHRIRTTGVRIERHGLGFAAHGPGFYVWDTEPRVLIDDASSLAGRALPRPPRPRPAVRKARRRFRDPAA
jgi:hypothetical protein